jgi:dihydroorotase
MRILIKAAKVVFPGHPLHGKVVDIQLRNGKILDIGKRIGSSEGEVFKAKNLHVSPGWFDLGASLGEPGMEQKETLESLSSAAIQGGFTDLAPFSNSSAPADNRAAVDFLIKQGERLDINLYPIGTLSKKMEGTQLTEMHDTRRQGAIAFSDGLKYVEDPSFFMKSLLYAKSVNAPVIHIPGLLDLHGDSQIHESKRSLELGLNGFPSAAEEIVTKRDLSILDYTGSSLITHLVSSREALRLIERAQRSGKNVYASVSALHLYSTVEEVGEYENSYKVLPPLRDSSDRSALRSGVKKGSIQIICSNHQPHETEAKDVEFSIAAFGSTGLEQAFGAMRYATAKDIDLETIISAISINPRKILGLNIPDLEVGKTPPLTLFDPDLEWQFTIDHVRSISRSNALIGKPMKGKVLGVMNKGRFFKVD